jgi:hypothetical protein
MKPRHQVPKRAVVRAIVSGDQDSFTMRHENNASVSLSFRSAARGHKVAAVPQEEFGLETGSGGGAAVSPDSQ